MTWDLDLILCDMKPFVSPLKLVKVKYKGEEGSAGMEMIDKMSK